MTTDGTWIGYSGTARIGLALILLAVAGGLAYAGTRWPGPYQARKRGPAVTNLLLAAWILAIAAFLVCVSLYVHQAAANSRAGRHPPIPSRRSPWSASALSSSSSSSPAVTAPWPGSGAPSSPPWPHR